RDDATPAMELVLVPKRQRPADDEDRGRPVASQTKGQDRHRSGLRKRWARLLEQLEDGPLERNARGHGGRLRPADRGKQPRPRSRFSALLSLVRRSRRDSEQRPRTTHGIRCEAARLFVGVEGATRGVEPWGESRLELRSGDGGSASSAHSAGSNAK